MAHAHDVVQGCLCTISLLRMVQRVRDTTWEEGSTDLPPTLAGHPPLSRGVYLEGPEAAACNQPLLQHYSQ